MGIMRFSEPLRLAREDAGERQLGPYVLPPFQRPPVWSMAQQILLIESLWNRLPVGSYVLNQTASASGDCDGWLLDGQQRITAILAYGRGDFPVFGYRFPDLPKVDRMALWMTPIGVYFTSMESKAECQEVYRRLAYGGTPHKPQEQRRDK